MNIVLMDHISIMKNIQVELNMYNSMYIFEIGLQRPCLQEIMVKE